MRVHAQATIPAIDTLSQRNFTRLAEYIHGVTGIKMASTKRTMLEGRLRRCMRGLGLGSLDEYCRYLFEEGGLERDQVVLLDAVTTNKTDFFREPTHFDYLAEKALPELVAGGRRRLKLWSAACSTGAEPYTLAMVMEEFLRTERGLEYEILGTDLSTRVLAMAHAGIYPETFIDPVPQDLRERYLTRSKDAGRAEVRIAPRLRARLSVGRLNLMDTNYPVETDMDVVFCRNVLIYFDKPTQEKVLSRLCAHLRPGGYLFLGHSESIAGISLPVKAVANTVFRKA